MRFFRRKAMKSRTVCRYATINLPIRATRLSLFLSARCRSSIGKLTVIMTILVYQLRLMIGADVKLTVIMTILVYQLRLMIGADV
jgi:hypothetical protein